MIEEGKSNILIVSSRSEGGGAEQFFNIMTKLRDLFKFYCALPDSPPYYDKIVNEKSQHSNSLIEGLKFEHF